VKNVPTHFDCHKVKYLLVKILIACMVVSGCGTHSARSTSEPAAVSLGVIPLSEYRVQAGDTLFSLAWKNNTTVDSLCKINAISRDSVLRVGQLIKLAGEPERKNLARISAPATEAAKPCCIKKQPESVDSVKKYEYLGRSLGWVWPVKGQVVLEYSAKGGLNKGIDIQTKLGESVVAASDGEVIFAGNGLKGYPNLVIVKHRGSYLSAYSNNHTLLVKEGDKVRKGQSIAQMGQVPRATRLHFEIRSDGKPVDPQKLLP
jgi:lipoprotein NlpD